MSFTRKSVYVPLPKVQRATPVVIGGDPKGATFTYANGSNIIVRNLANPLDAYTYSEHSAETTVAKYAPSGFYIASADVTGKVRIWDTTNAEHMLKYEYRPISGAIRDLAWTDDSKRIVVCGEGNEVFARAFLWDSGSSVGEITGHSKRINSCDVKQTRPYRVVTASEDNDVGVYAGPPFKFQQLNHDHTRFVNSIRYSPDGNFFLSGGADAKCFLYDGKEGKMVAELNGGAAAAHEAGVMAVSWSPDNKHAITASSDKTVKLWDVQANACVTTFTFGEELEWQQLGCLWQGQTLISTSLNGFINYLDPNAPAKPSRSIQGHTKYVTSFAVDHASGHFYSGDYEGRVSRVSIATGESTVLAGAHTNLVNDIKIQGGSVVTTSLDDSLKVTPLDAPAMGAEALHFDSAPKGGVAAGRDGVLVAACLKELVVIRAGKKVSALPVAYEPLSIDIAPNNIDVAVGDAVKKIHVYTLNGDALTLKFEVDASGPVEDVKYSPDGKWLSSADAQRNLFCFAAEAAYERTVEFVKYHTAKINTVAWAPNSQFLATGSLDTNIMVWNVLEPLKKIKLLGAHPQAGVTKVEWLSDTTLLSSGLDACVRTFEIKHA